MVHQVYKKNSHLKYYTLFYSRLKIMYNPLGYMFRLRICIIRYIVLILKANNISYLVMCRKGV